MLVLALGLVACFAAFVLVLGFFVKYIHAGPNVLYVIEGVTYAALGTATGCFAMITFVVLMAARAMIRPDSPRATIRLLSNNPVSESVLDKGHSGGQHMQEWRAIASKECSALRYFDYRPILAAVQELEQMEQDKKKGPAAAKPAAPRPAAEIGQGRGFDGEIKQYS
ncbi:MAG: hypothetical protein MO853_09615 [Candidatus Protistobacter heckmanni]|nr:hypothetical protein [Candidatus Protistobacter heckmanni]